jgi:hypothetical protein
MDRRHEPPIPLLWMTLVAGLMAAPLLALAQSQAIPNAQPGEALASHPLR